MRVLVVDGERDQRETVCRGLFLCGHEACPAATPTEAASLLAAGDFDLLLTDVTTPRDLATLEMLRRLASSLPLLITTALTDLSVLDCFCAPVLTKPFTPDELDEAVRAAKIG